MNLEEIKTTINKKITEYSTPYEKAAGYQICQEYASKENNQIKRVIDLLYIDFWNCIKCLIYVYCEGKINPDDCLEITKKMQSVFKDLSFSDADDFVDIMWSIAVSPEYDQIMKQLKSTSKLSLPNPLNRNDVSKISKKHIKKLKTKDQNEEFFLYLVGVLRNNPNSINVFNFLVLRKKIEMESDKIDFLLQQRGINDANFAEEVIKSMLGDMYSFDEIAKDHNSIHNFVYEEEKKEAKQNQNNGRKARNYTKALELLEEASKKQEITNAKDIIKSIPDEEIKKMVLLWIYNHNNQYYEQLNDRLEEVSANNKNQYLAVLSKHKLKLPMNQVITIMHHTKEDVDEILSLLEKYNYTDEDLLKILKKTTKSKVDAINQYISLGYIDSDKVVENYSIYYQNDSKLEIMKKTIKGIVGLGINPKFFQSQPHCLWQEQSHLYNNLILLIEYNLTKNLKNCKNFEFLLEEKLEEKIDLLIELGYYEYLENGIEILNYPRETLKRLELLKQMNIPLDDIEILEDVLENPKFIVKDSDLDQYIMDYAAYDDENSVSIESFNMNDIDKISISIGDSIFSMPKIKRNLYEGKTLLKAMFYRKRVTEEEYKQVINILTNHTNYSI